MVCGQVRGEPISEDQQKEYKQATSGNRRVGGPTKMHQRLGRSETLDEVYFIDRGNVQSPPPAGRQDIK